MPKKYAQEDIVYKYEELDSFAQDRAMEKWASGEYENGFYDDKYEREYIGDLFKCLGLTVDTYAVKLYGGGVRYDYNFYFDWEYSNCFTFKGWYRYQKGWRELLKKAAYWQSGDTPEICGERLQKLSRKYFYLLEGTIDLVEAKYKVYRNPPITIKHQDDSDWMGDSRVTAEDETEFIDIIQDLCDWAWKILYDQYMWIGSEERALGEDGEFEQGQIYFSEDGREIYYNLTDGELEDYVEEDQDLED